MTLGGNEWGWYWTPLLRRLTFVSIVAGYRAGLMRTLVEFVGYLFAVVASVVLAGLVADGLADLFLQARSPSPAEYYFLRVIATGNRIRSAANVGTDHSLGSQCCLPSASVTFGQQPVGRFVWGI